MHTFVSLLVFQMFGGETAHLIAVKAARYGLTPTVWKPETSPILVSELYAYIHSRYNVAN